MDEIFYCPECGSDELYFDRRGFDSSNAIRGAFFFGAKGFLAGLLGSEETVVVCRRCGCICSASAVIESRREKFKKQQQSNTKEQKPQEENMGCVSFVVMIILLILLMFGPLIFDNNSPA